MGASVVDERLKDWATPAQAELIDAVNEHGSACAAGRALGVDNSYISKTIRILLHKASLQGYAPGHFESGVAPGYRMGKVTVQRDAGGEVVQTWERQSPDVGRLWEALQAQLEAAKEELPKVAPLAPPSACDADLLTVYPFGDPHCGLYAWEEETGNRYDLAEFERVNLAAVDRLVASTPPSGLAIFNDKGDSTHADNSKNRTPRSGHELDVHGRHGEVVRVSVRVKRHQINRLLEKHAQVIVRVDPGNHDPETALLLALILEAMYENEPRVQVITSPNPYWYYRFGANLIGTCHGDGAKGRDLPLIMATDQPQAWGDTEFRLWLVGHVHHKDVKEYAGCTVEYLRTLAAADAYSHGKGYRSKRDLQAITLHRTDGEVERHTCSLKRLSRLPDIAA
jgi:hypothetical protein